MLSDYDIASQAAKKVLDADIIKFVPPFFQGKIPADATQKTADEIAKAVVDALKQAHSA